jgi:putative heme-binding domain-containing protein
LIYGAHNKSKSLIYCGVDVNLGDMSFWMAIAATLAQEHVQSSDPLPPHEQQKRFRLPPGFRIQLVASEPDIAKPMNIAFDDRGRLLVTQSVEYPFPAKPGARPRDKVMLLEDSDGDGRADKFTTHVDELNIPIGVAPTSDGCIVFSIPKIWRCTDRDGDGLCEKREPLYGDIGYEDSHGMANSFTWGLDGWIYACHGFHNKSTLRGSDGHAITMNSGNTFRMRPDGTRVERYTFGQVNPFGMCFDPFNNLYTADCHSKPATLLLRGAWYSNFEQLQDGLGLGPTLMDHPHGSTGIAGVVFYDASQFPKEYANTLFPGNPVTARVNHDRLQETGSGFRAVEQPDFLRCDDPWFRPVDLKLAPDGTLYIADFYNRIIAHYEVPLDHSGRDRARGRIWRVVYEGAPPKPMADLSKATTAELVHLLKDGNVVVRSMATNRLVESHAQEAPELLKNVLDPCGLWVLDRLGALDHDLVTRLAGDKDARVRTHLLKALAERKTWGAVEQSLAREMLGDEIPMARRAAAEALGLHPDPANLKPLLDAWKETPAEDLHLIHTIRMALRNHLMEPGAYEGLDVYKDHSARLADVSIGVRNAESAAFVFSKGATSWSLLHHVARYIAPEKLGDVVAFARKSFGGREIDAALALQRASIERGIKLEDIRAWGGQVARAAFEKETGQALKLIRDLGIEELQDDVARVAQERSRHQEAAIEALTSLDRSRALPVLGRILGNASEPFPVRQKAAWALGVLGTVEGREELARQLRTAPAALAAKIVVELTGTREGTNLLLTEVEQGRASRQLLRLLRVVRRVEEAGAGERLSLILKDLPPEEDRMGKMVKHRVAAYREARGDPAAGAMVFEKNCATCHSFAGVGKKVGPELDGIGQRGIERLIEDILDPNRNIDHAFLVTNVLTKDGRTIFGLVLREEGEALVIQENDTEVRIAIREIEKRVRSQFSPMPENFADAIAEQDFHNLVQFLLGPTPQPFRKVRLTDTFTSEGATFGDFNRDGKMDVASGPYWHEGPGFLKKHEIYEPKVYEKTGYSDNFLAFTHDFNGDGWMDVLVVGYPGRKTVWFENPQGREERWKRNVLFDVTDTESPGFADLTGDGVPELICATGGRLGYVTLDGKFHAVTPKAAYHRFTHGLGIGDVNGDGRADVLEAGGWWEQPKALVGDPEWTKHAVDFGKGGAQMFAYDVDGDGDNDVITSLDAHGYGLAWFEQTKEGFTKRIIDDVAFSQPHALALEDMDGDGLKDIVTGKRHWAHGPDKDPDPQGPAVLYWFQLTRRADGVRYVPHLIDDASGVGTQVTVGEITGDKLSDVIVGNKLGTFLFLQKEK